MVYALLSRKLWDGIRDSLSQTSTHALCPDLRMPAIENSLNAQLPLYGEDGQTGDEGRGFIFIHKQGK